MENYSIKNDYDKSEERKWDIEKVQWNRLTPFDDVIEVIGKMTGDKLGAIGFVKGMIERKYLFEIYICDNLKLYGGELYLFWNDCCHRDFAKVSDLLYKYHTGKISELFIKRHIKPTHGLPINTFGEWVKSSKSIGEFFQPEDLVSEDFIAFFSELGEAAVIARERLIQLRSNTHAHKDNDGKVTSLYTTFKQINGVWIYYGECTELPGNFCDICPCSTCLRCIPDGSKEDCHACDICFDGDISVMYPSCPLQKRGSDLLKRMEPSRITNFFCKGEFIQPEYL